jgi:predicted transcriptional regulator of viral defense system
MRIAQERTMKSSRERLNRLYEIAAPQDGYFTARQARAAGYETNGQTYHVRAGNWIREHRGIYRLASYPLAERPDLILWCLWSFDRQDRPQGVYSHATALSLYELSDVNPARIHMTVPAGFRRRAEIPGALVLHRGALPESERREMWSVPVTTPLRTLIDVIGDGALSEDLIRQAVRQALDRGLVARRSLLEGLRDWPGLSTVTGEPIR